MKRFLSSSPLISPPSILSFLLLFLPQLERKIDNLQVIIELHPSTQALSLSEVEKKLEEKMKEEKREREKEWEEREAKEREREREREIKEREKEKETRERERIERERVERELREIEEREKEEREREKKERDQKEERDAKEREEKERKIKEKEDKEREMKEREEREKEEEKWRGNVIHPLDMGEDTTGIAFFFFLRTFNELTPFFFFFFFFLFAVILQLKSQIQRKDGELGNMRSQFNVARLPFSLSQFGFIDSLSLIHFLFRRQIRGGRKKEICNGRKISQCIIVCLFPLPLWSWKICPFNFYLFIYLFIFFFTLDSAKKWKNYPRRLRNYNRGLFLF